MSISTKTSLARWLDAHRATLLPQWIAQANGVNHVANGHDAPIHPDESVVLLSSLYGAMISAADGDTQPLDECLRFLRALRSTPGEEELGARLSMIFQLRSLIWDQLFADSNDPRELRPVLEELETLLAQTSLMLTNHWATSASSVSRQLQQTEMLLATLNEATDQSDRLVLQISNLNDLARTLASSLDPEHLIRTVGEKLMEVLDIAQVVIWLADAQESLYVVYSAGAIETIVQRLDEAPETDLVLRSFRSNETLLEFAPEPPTQGAWYQPGCTVMAVPMIAQDHAIGVILLQEPAATERLSRSQQSFVSSAASQTAIALQNARLYDEVRSFNSVLNERIAERTRELQTERDMLETLRQIALEVGSTLDVNTLLEHCLNLLAEIVGVQHGSVMLIEPETEHLVDRAMLGNDREPGYIRFPVGQGIVGWVAQYKKPAVIQDVTQDERWVELPEDTKLVHKRGGSMLAVPLIIQYDAMGVIMLSHEQTNFFTDDHLRLLTASAGEIALGIHNALLYEQIQQQLIRQGEMLRNERRATSQSTAILQSLSDGVIVCDTEGAVITVNPAVERILARPIEELVIWNLRELMGRLLGERSRELPVDDLLAQPIDNQQQPRSYSTKFEIDNRVIRLTLDPVMTSRSEVLGAVAVLRDITREVESERVKDEFIGTVSHELRTPMTSIKGYTQLLAMGSLGPINDSQKEFLKTIHTNADRMISIINDLLDITKIETGTVELDRRPLHVAEALGNVITELQGQLQAREHDLNIDIPPGLPLVKADARRFDQILSNLISNAIKYTPRGGKINLVAQEATEAGVPEEHREGLRAGRYVRISIRDTGVGIPPEELDRIFERFYRTENPLRIEAGGTGLGLSLVRPLVKLFGGRIWVESTVGEGSMFAFVIPAV
ncbi:MAG TPA: GAF domain-containing protein [Roseiflexaceae bacterium]|nr:GAF domain-containing protein [Roseiflexaceae bacterium]